MENTTNKTWQEEMAELIAKVPEEKKERVRDFLMGGLAMLKAENRQQAS